MVEEPLPCVGEYSVVLDSKEMGRTGFPFTDDLDVVCEEFEVVFSCL